MMTKQNNEGEQYLKNDHDVKTYTDMKEINLKVLVNIQIKF